MEEPKDKITTAYDKKVTNNPYKVPLGILLDGFLNSLDIPAPEKIPAVAQKNNPNNEFIVSVLFSLSNSQSGQKLR